MGKAKTVTYEPGRKSMPRASKKEADDLDEEIEGEEEEETEEEEEEESEDEDEGEEEESADEEEEEESEEESEEEEPEIEKVPARTTGKKHARAKKKAAKTKFGHGILLINGRPIKVEVLSVRGQSAKVKRPGGGDEDIRRVASSDLKVYDEGSFAKLQGRYEKISDLQDSQVAAHAKLPGFKAKPVKKRGRDPFAGW